jgi:hypothetical protein
MSILSQGDSHVKTYQLPTQMELDLQEKEVDYGLSYSESSEKLSPVGLLSKMLLTSKSWAWTQFFLDWKQKVTKQGHLLYQLVPHPPRTEEIGYGLLPTLVASDSTSGEVLGEADQFYITQTGMPRKINRNGKDGSVGLGRLIRLLPILLDRKVEYKLYIDGEKIVIPEAVKAVLLRIPEVKIVFTGVNLAADKVFEGASIALEAPNKKVIDKALNKVRQVLYDGEHPIKFRTWEVKSGNLEKRIASLIRNQGTDYLEKVEKAKDRVKFNKKKKRC